MSSRINMNSNISRSLLNIIKNKHIKFTLIVIGILAVYTVAIRPFLIKSDATVGVELSLAGMLFLALTLFFIALIVTALITLITYLFSNKKKNLVLQTLRLRVQGAWALTIAVNLLLVVVLSQNITYTPPILDENGKILNGSIAELKQLNINGSKQWVTIRGNSPDAPVILFLAGGPGGSQLAATRIALRELEKHFIVVNWDQPGSGKSFGAVSRKDITIRRYIDDGVELTRYLQKRFNKDKIYIVGESWGSALGIFLAKVNPELYHGFIGTGQMVSFLETEKTDYDLAKKLANTNGDLDLIEKLEQQGPPPYYGSDVTWKSASYLMYLSEQMARNPEISNSGYNTLAEIAAPEYGIFDKVNYFRGIVSTFNHVYPQLYDVDFRKDAVKIDIPVYFLIGRHDMNAPTDFVEDYYNKLNAPVKELIWFEHSGHDPWRNESDKFAQSIIDISSK